MRIAATEITFCILIFSAALISVESLEKVMAVDKVTGRITTQEIPKPIFSNDTMIFNIFTTQIPEVNEGTLGTSGDVYSLPVMIVKSGDNVTINFYNDDRDAGDRHTFTINEPFNINKDLATGSSAGINFKADHQGLFMYYCTYHPKTMYGTMLVLP
jgi:plastocyanin